jgi:hypothetical protein
VKEMTSMKASMKANGLWPESGNGVIMQCRRENTAGLSAEVMAKMASVAALKGVASAISIEMSASCQY